MRVYLGSDHAGFELKTHLLHLLARAGHETVDLGPLVFDPEDDYPAYCLATGAAVVADPGSLGVVIGGSGNGEQIAANKVPGVRCALAWDVETASLGRRHNDANVVSLGARMLDEASASAIVDAFVTTAFSDEARHARRIAQLTEYERSHALPGRPAG